MSWITTFIFGAWLIHMLYPGCVCYDSISHCYNWGKKRKRRQIFFKNLKLRCALLNCTFVTINFGFCLTYKRVGAFEFIERSLISLITVSLLWQPFYWNCIKYLFPFNIYIGRYNVIIIYKLVGFLKIYNFTYN